MNIINKIALQSGLARFASFTYTSKSTGEVSKYVIQIGFSYRNLLQKSINQLEIDKQIMPDFQRQAAEAVQASLEASLNGTQNKYTKKDIYENYKDSNGQSIQGIKINRNDNSIKVYGLISSKTQISPPTIEKKLKESSPLVIEKEKILKNLPVGRFREFALDNLLSARLNGETLTLE